MVRRQRTALLLVALLLVAIFALYVQTFTSMVTVWLESSTFLHGVLILPMSAYLIWQKRHIWLEFPIVPSSIGVALLAVAVFAWVIAELVSVQLVAQLAFIAMLGASIWSLLGTQISNVLRFPLLYAFMAVPFGEFLIPPLMDWTADATVFALKVTGIPVYRESNFFSLPSGNFEVIEACSGVKFLLVTVVLGLYFAHETYHSRVKRWVFVVLVTVAIIFANWIRAYIVVLTAHLTELRYGTGDSHIYLGWLVFLLAITTLFWLGRKYEDVEIDHNAGANTDNASDTKSRRAYIDILSVFAVASVLLISGDQLLDTARSRTSGDVPSPKLPILAGQWSGPNLAMLNYAPDSDSLSEVLAARYSQDSSILEFHVVFYPRQEQGRELVGWRSQPIDLGIWRRFRRESIELVIGNEKLRINSFVVSDGNQDLLLWYWYDVGGYLTPSPGIAKMRQAWNLIRGRNLGDGMLVLVTPMSNRQSRNAYEFLKQFLQENLALIEECIRPGDENTFLCKNTYRDSSGR